jgi:hypothetical protein
MSEYKSINYNAANLKGIPRNFEGNNTYVVNNNDPIHAMFLKRNKVELGEENIDLTPLEHNKSDIVELEEFCKKYGILAANFGNISPSVALRMLKGKMGIYEEPNLNKKDKHLLKG